MAIKPIDFALLPGFFGKVKLFCLSSSEKGFKADSGIKEEKGVYSKAVNDFLSSDCNYF